MIKFNDEFCKKYGIKNVYRSGEGICHYILVEQGFVSPGKVIIGSDSHTTVYGDFGAFSCGCGNQSIVATGFAYGKVWLRVPSTVRIVIEGKSPDYITPRDVINYAIREVGDTPCIYKAIEWAGSYIENLSVEERYIFTLMSVEMGAKTGFVEPDKKTEEYMKKYYKGELEFLHSDPDKKYDQEFRIDVSKLEPTVTFPPAVTNVNFIGEAKGIKINQASVGCCTDAHVEDFHMVAKMLDGKKVHPDCRFLIVPGTRAIYNELMEDGTLTVLAKAGCNIFPASCGVCQTVNMAAQAPGDVMISTAPRNFPGRTGSDKARHFLASPLTVAASALCGEITDPRKFM
jgi:homoaconitase/3-isopropylmalate dehydratase large subunit